MISRSKTAWVVLASRRDASLDGSRPLLSRAVYTYGTICDQISIVVLFQSIRGLLGRGSWQTYVRCILITHIRSLPYLLSSRFVLLSASVATLQRQVANRSISTSPVRKSTESCVANVYLLTRAIVAMSDTIRPRPHQQQCRSNRQHCRSNVRLCRSNIRLCCHKRQQCRTILL